MLYLKCYVYQTTELDQVMGMGGGGRRLQLFQETAWPFYNTTLRNYAPDLFMNQNYLIMQLSDWLLVVNYIIT